VRYRSWPLGLDRRHFLVRYVAPALFLLAVTVIVLVVRGGLSSDSTPAKSPPVVKKSGASSTRAKPVPPKHWYIIKSGDTLGAIAAELNTTVPALERLNPGIEPTALTPGGRLRVK